MRVRDAPPAGEGGKILTPLPSGMRGIQLNTGSRLLTPEKWGFPIGPLFE